MLFFELIQVSLGTRIKLSHTPSEEEWAMLYDMSQKQSVSGLAFLSLDKLSENGQKPPLNILYDWIGLSEQIKKQNILLDRRTIDISNLFAAANFRTCILKGQGNSRLYPVPSSRTPGDIDIWVYGYKHHKTNQKCLRNRILEFVKERTTKAREQYHHIDFPIYDDVSVEVHFTPGRLLNPIYNRRFQKFPNIVFNAVYQMAHIMIHFFIEGIGLRHFVDYYYVLTNINEGLRDEIIVNFHHLGLDKFARGVMWIEHYCLGLDKEHLLLEPSEKIGRIIQTEMLEGGNFGHYDQRYKIRNKGYLMRGLVDSFRLMRFAFFFPQDVFWKLLLKIENQRWKI